MRRQKAAQTDVCSTIDFATEIGADRTESKTESALYLDDDRAGGAGSDDASAVSNGRLVVVLQLAKVPADGHLDDMKDDACDGGGKKDLGAWRGSTKPFEFADVSKQKAAKRRPSVDS